ncbi:hypothetical protein L2E82_04246 [Cichorium intybus]|uniref:Uncharacterized protein n=1 Tax=Cichorium intybus TaxID=13427 RepID=A0ACB9H547_CICIN|nr:hypothetical protein L2E82_04246 [Cichorium intybus]
MMAVITVNGGGGGSSGSAKLSSCSERQEAGDNKEARDDVSKLGVHDMKLKNTLLDAVDEDHLKFLRRLRERIDMVGNETPKIEVRYENLSVEGDGYVGDRALPSLYNVIVNSIENTMQCIGITPSKKRKVQILQAISGIIKPSRLTLLLGPPGAGKTTLLLALAGKIDHDLKVSGNVTYCGHQLSEFTAQRTCAYISPNNLHTGEMTVRETFDFSGRCLGVGPRYKLLAEILKMEKEAGTKPDPDINAFMNATTGTNFITEYVLKILGLENCADTMIGDQMRRGISGGEKKRVTTGEIIPLSLMESGIWVVLTYYTIGYAPDAIRFGQQFLTFFAIHQMALSLFRMLAAVARTEVIANTVGAFTMLLIVTLGGFIVAKDDSEAWISWGFYVSPMMYAQNALVINEFLDKRWSMPNMDPRINASTIGEALLKSRSFYAENYWFWISLGALFGFSIVFNILFIIALTFLDPIVDAKPVMREENDLSTKEVHEGIDMAVIHTSGKNDSTTVAHRMERRGMVLPFQPLSLAFNHVNYYIDTPFEMKARGFKDDRLQLLNDVSGAFRPGILTALIGVSGAGKTTLMDVLAGRKTGGYTEGSIFISGYPKNQSTFARVSGYCEQNDIHSPNVTVYESLLYSAWLRLSSDVNTRTRKIFVDELMELVELNPLRNALVGLPGVDGLTIEQRKRLTIAVELVANPSIIFLDEPTSGLDARAAAIVMRTVRNTVDTGRTVVCTIHQPSIDIFESFDELLLMKIGGQIIYAGPLGHQSHKLVEYFQAIRGVPRIKNGYNPATWVLEVTSSSVESQLSVDYAQIYANSTLYQDNQELIKELSAPPNGSKDLFFRTKFTQPFIIQCKACLWKQHWSYWRNPQYNLIRFITTIVVAGLFGAIFFKKGENIQKLQDMLDFLGALYAIVLFLGAINQNSVQPIVFVERTVFYRERAAGMYSSLPYALAQVMIESTYIAIQTSIYCFFLYPMMGLGWTAAKFLWFYYYMLMSFISFTLFGMVTMALSPNPQISAVLIYFFICLWNLFSGFIIPRPQIPIWCRWYYWANPFSWTIYGLVTSQIGKIDDIVEVPGAGNVTVKGFIKERFGYDYDFLPIVATAHIGWILLFFFIFVYAIKFLNFQHR